MQPLGDLVSVHPVNNARRWRLGIEALLVGGVPASLVAILIVTSWVDPSVAFGRLTGLALVLAVPALPIAVTQLAKAIRGGFRESYEIHDRGLVHVRWGTRRGWTWEQVYGVVTTESDWGRRFGRDFRCVVSLRGGATVRFNGLTRNARAIAEKLKSRCPDAVGKEHGSRMVEIFENIAPWLAAAFAIVFGLATWWIVDHILTNEEQTDQFSPSYVAGVEPLSDAALGGLTVLILVCGLGSLFSAIAAIVLIRDYYGW